MSLLNRLFQLQDNQTTASREIIAGLTTLFTLAYIVIVAPNMLHKGGMPEAGAFESVCLVAGGATLLNAFLANLPFGVAPGLGLLSYFAYTLTQQQHIPWQVALGAVFISGLIFMIITITKLRQAIIKAIPHSLGCAIGSGIGLFIGFIGLRNAGVIQHNVHTLVTLGPLDHFSVLMFFACFFMIAFLDYKKVPGALLIGMLIVSIIGFICHKAHFVGVVAVPKLHQIPWFQLSLKNWDQWQMLPVIFTFLIVALSDSTGTIMGLTQQMGLKRDEPQAMRRIHRGLLSESIATTCSGLIGSSTVCPFVESASGIKAGGRTGLTGLVIGIGLLLLLFFSPLAMSVPEYATSAALFFVCCMMLKPITNIQWEDATEYMPAIITILMIPLTYSISDGFGLGVLSFVVLKLLSLRWREIHPVMWFLAVIFVVYFWGVSIH